MCPERSSGPFVLEILLAIAGVAVLGFLLYVPGALLLNLIARRSRGVAPFRDVAEWLFTALFLGFLLVGLVGFLLAEMGLFSWWAILIVVLLASLAMSAVLRRFPLSGRHLLALVKPPTLRPDPTVGRRLASAELLGLIALVVAIIILYAPPHH